MGASLYGGIYDLDLSIQADAIVRIDTKPPQTLVAKNGTYRFSVPPGNYVITATYSDSIAKEEIEVAGAGEYVLDLLLGPDFEEEDIPIDNPEEPPVVVATSYTWLWFLLSAIVLFLIGVKTLPKRSSEDLEPLIQFIREHDGRIVQANIVKHFPQSEAKISLMLTELESLGKIKKIKKGRGNVIILQ
jgi:uncharacterized membrane protein